MNTYDCKAIQREIDEASLDARLTAEVNEHLSQCDRCRRFHDEGRTLRGLMAELETVGAPADFDFRLRARLARERPSNGFHHLLLSARPLAALALVILIAVVAFVVKSRMSSPGAPAVVTRIKPNESVEAANAGHIKTPLAPPASAKDDSQKNTATASVVNPRPVPVSQQGGSGPRNTVAQRPSNTSAGNVARPNSATRDSAGTGAPMITPDYFSGLVVVPVDARVFKLSIDNGRGEARTISLPPVSFGSQRLLTRETSFVPVSSTKGDW